MSTILDPAMDKELVDRAEFTLRRLRISGKLMGFRYLTYAVARTVVDPSLLSLVTKILYFDIARAYQTTPTRAERAIRHAIRRSWENGSQELLEELAGCALMKCPSNTEFIDIVAFYLRHQ